MRRASRGARPRSRASGGEAYGGGGGSSSPKPTTTPGAPTGTPNAAASVRTATVTVGGSSETVLVDGQGLVLYYYTPDKHASVTCTGGCAGAWPPFKASTAPGATGTFGLAADPDGGQVVTYNGWPLYTFAADTPGQAGGQGVGGIWSVATPKLAATATGH